MTWENLTILGKNALLTSEKKEREERREKREEKREKKKNREILA